MKKILSIFCAAVMLVLALSLTACGNSDDISGEYRLISMTAAGEDLSPYLEMMGEVTLTIDGESATLTMGDDVTTLTVDKESQTMVAEDGTSSPYTVDGNTLSLVEASSDSSMVFEKK